MENNIFLKKKDKYNPDIISNMSQTAAQRKQSQFQASNNVYNPITNIVPNNIRKQQDLKLTMDTTMNTYEFKTLMKQKEDERQKQNNDLKPQKLKNLQMNNLNDKHIDNFEELKKKSEDNNMKISQEYSNQKKNYNNVFLKLKKNGLI